MRNSIQRSFLPFMILAMTQLACRLTQPAPAPTATFTASPLPATSTPVPSATASPTPTITLTPLPTATPTPHPLIEAGAPLPEYQEPIAYDNAFQVHALAEWRQQAITSMELSADGQRLAVGGAAQVDFYDLRTRLKQGTLPVEEGLVDFAISKDGRYLASASNAGTEQGGYTGSVSFWRLSDQERLFIYYLDRRGVSGVTFSPDGKIFVAGVTSPTYIDNNFIFWNSYTFEITRTMRTGGVLDLAFSPDGLAIASTPDRFAIRMWRLKDGQLLYELPTSFTGAVNCLTFSPDGSTLATGHYDGAIRLWDVPKGELKQEFSLEGVVESLAFSPDSTLLASGEGYRGFAIHIWDVTNGQRLQTLLGHTHAVDHLAFSPDGHLLVSASYDGTLRLWAVRP
jgi:WD40 repeat protein